MCSKYTAEYREFDAVWHMNKEMLLRGGKEGVVEIYGGFC